MDAFELLEESPATAKRSRARTPTAGHADRQQGSQHSPAYAETATCSEQQGSDGAVLPRPNTTKVPSLATTAAACTPTHSKHALAHVPTPAASSSTNTSTPASLSDLASSTPLTNAARRTSSIAAAKHAEDYSDLSAAPTPQTHDSQGAHSDADAAAPEECEDAAAAQPAVAQWVTRAQGRRSSILAHAQQPRRLTLQPAATAVAAHEQQGPEKAAAQRLQHLQRLSTCNASAWVDGAQWQPEQQWPGHGRLSLAELHRRLSLAGPQQRMSLAGAGLQPHRPSLAAGPRASFTEAARLSMVDVRESVQPGSAADEATDATELQAGSAQLEDLADDLQGLKIEEGEEDEGDADVADDETPAVALTPLEQLLDVCGQEVRLLCREHA